MSSHEPTLFIPGPTEVFPEILAQLARPLISHRGPEIAAITREIFDGLRLLFGTTNECFVATSSATGIMEALTRQLSTRRILVTVCGAFSERQLKVAHMNGKEADALVFAPGKAVDPEAVEARLATGLYDLVTCVHSETSTGILNPIAEIGRVVRRHPEVFYAVDCVSSLAGAAIDVDAAGIDLAFAGTQKCLALPPGLALFCVSPRAMDRAASIPDRGYYFDFLNYRKMAAKGQCPATTAIPLIVALGHQLGRIRAEGLEARFERHRKMAALVRERMEGILPPFTDVRHRSPSVSVFANDRGLSIAALVDAVRRRGPIIGNGYGDLKEKCFRVGHMGDLQPEHLDRLMDIVIEELARLGASRR